MLEKPVLKFLEKHKWESMIIQFEKSLNIISKNPFENNLDIKPLRWLDNNYRLRIGKYRFIYEIIEDIVSISFFKAGVRWRIYKNI